MKSRRHTAVLALMALLLLGMVARSGLLLEGSEGDGGSGESVLAGAESLAISSNDAEALQTQSLNAVKATDLGRASTSNGEGQVIAVVDTGISPAIGIFGDPAGSLRVTKWVDLTDEGRSPVTSVFPVEGKATAGGTTLTIGPLPGRSQSVLLGRLPEVLSNRAGLLASPFFLLVDPFVEGQFDAVIVDCDDDKDFWDEQMLLEFDVSGASASISGSAGEYVPFVVADIASTGSSVTFGFDLVGHGTALAAIAAASGPGAYRGVAPGASLISIKAVPTDRSANWADILEGIRLATDSKADVVLVGSVPNRPLTGPAWVQMQKTARDRGVHMVLPAGNNGPGVGTLTVTTESDLVLVVGGWLQGGLRAGERVLTTEDGVYLYSSYGPDSFGNRGISVIAPAIAAVPEEVGGSGYRFRLIEGTSVSSAFAAGSVTLLRSTSRVHSVPGDASRISKALTEGAQPIKGLTPVEQGGGRVDLMAAWDLWRARVGSSGLLVSRKWDGVVSTGGLWLRDAGLGALPVWVDNLSPFQRRVDMSSSGDWLSLESDHLSLAAVAQREVWVRSRLGLAPGFYSSEVWVDDPSTPGIDGRLVLSTVVPLTFGGSEASQRPGTIQLLLKPDPVRGLSRTFFKVPSSAEAMSLEIRGRAGVRFFLYSPKGFLVRSGDVVGSLSLSVGLPESGVWQLCLIDSRMRENADAADISLSVRLEGTFVENRGTSVNHQELTLVSDRSGEIQWRLSAASPTEEWLYRYSGQVSSRYAAVVTYPEVKERTAALSLRLGTSSQASLRAYLYRFDQTLSKWVQVAETSTGTNGLGTLYYRTPTAGRYVAYVEASSGDPQVYAEMEALVIETAEQAQVKPPASSDGFRTNAFGQRTGEIRVTPRLGDGSPRYMIIQPESGDGILGVVERSALTTELPVVQISGGPALDGRSLEVQTLRAWTAVGNYPLDLVLAVAGKQYQLDEGKVSAIFEHPGPITWRPLGQAGVFVFELQTPGGR